MRNPEIDDYSERYQSQIREQMAVRAPEKPAKTPRGVRGLQLPLPPTVNTYIRHTSRGHYKTKAAKDFDKTVAALVAHLQPFSPDDRLAVRIEVFPRDKRRQDIDNRIKSCCDALESAGLIPDDSQIDRLSISRAHIVKGGACQVEIEVLK